MTKKPQLYPDANCFLDNYYVKTGEFRIPEKGDFYLSGGIPEVFLAIDTLERPYHIMRKATVEETICPTCHQRLPIDYDDLDDDEDVL